MWKKIIENKRMSLVACLVVFLVGLNMYQYYRWVSEPTAEEINLLMKGLNELDMNVVSKTIQKQIEEMTKCDCECDKKINIEVSGQVKNSKELKKLLLPLLK